MKPAGWLALALSIALPLASATHDVDCTVGEADPATYMLYDSVVDLDGDGLSEIYYCEERDTGLPPIFLTGFLLGNGTWCYEENRNYFPDADGSMQRGGVGLLGDWFPPGCDQDPFGEGKIVSQGAGPGLVEDPVGWAGRLSVNPSGTAPGVPCLIIGMDPITDETCHHAFTDDLVFGAKRAF